MNKNGIHKKIENTSSNYKDIATTWISAARFPMPSLKANLNCHATPPWESGTDPLRKKGSRRHTPIPNPFLFLHPIV